MPQIRRRRKHDDAGLSRKIFCCHDEAQLLHVRSILPPSLPLLAQQEYPRMRPLETLMHPEGHTAPLYCSAHSDILCAQASYRRPLLALKNGRYCRCQQSYYGVGRSQPRSKLRTNLVDIHKGSSCLRSLKVCYVGKAWNDCHLSMGLMDEKRTSQ